jgi:hypothetical protein
MRAHRAESIPGVLKTLLVGGALIQALSETRAETENTSDNFGESLLVKVLGTSVDAIDKTNDDRQRQLNTLIGLSDRFGESLTNAFAKNVAEGKKFDDVLKSVRQSLVETGLRMALAPLQLALSQSAKTIFVANS